jgi:UDPglucose 6-dehydrogenase
MNHIITKMSKTRVGIIGAGFVGLSFAVVLAQKGFQVILIDKNRKKIEKIDEKNLPFFEPKLSTYFLKSSKRIEFSYNFELLKKCEIIFITVGTPIGTNGMVDLSNVKQVGKEIGKILLKSDFNPTLVLKSTVIPGTSRKILKIIEDVSKKKVGEKFDFVANPEFLREGKAIDDTENPHVIVVGGQDDVAKEKIVKFYKNVYKKKIPVFLTNYETAELIKYANNAFLATKISFINQISNICDNIPSANIDDIANAIGIDPRIGGLFLKAGPGYGGSCLPKDLQALISYSEKLGELPSLLKAVQKTNDHQVSKIFNVVKKQLKNLNQKKISILGLSFKEDSDDIRESVSIKLISKLIQQKSNVVVHDPMAIENTKKIFKNKIQYSDSIPKIINESDCLIIMTPWEEYKKLNNSDFQKMKNKLIIDTRRLLKNKKIHGKYLAIGINLDENHH